MQSLNDASASYFKPDFRCRDGDTVWLGSLRPIGASIQEALFTSQTFLAQWSRAGTLWLWLRKQKQRIRRTVRTCPERIKKRRLAVSVSPLQIEDTITYADKYDCIPYIATVE